jgi:2,4-dienoyl-CoA reductase-like NADH-dependent reductase (Old Yellow Enzyme family)
MHFPRVATLKTATDFLERQIALGIELPYDERVLTGPEAPLAQPYRRARGTVGNRFCILPMEGWDGTEDGRPTDLTRRRWRNFGRSGAKLIWGGEAVAVRHDGRANPNQLILTEETVGDLAALRELVQTTHRERFGTAEDLLIGLQLTHSGRFAQPSDPHRPEPRILYRHPVLDARNGIDDDQAILSDDDIAELVDDFVAAARLAHRAGFAFVDLKHCHGYLGHEFLSAVDRPGRYGGSLENRTRFLRDIVSGIRALCPSLEIGVRLSVFDFIPFQPGPDGVGVPVQAGESYRHAFGGDGTGVGINLDEPSALLDLLERLQIELVCMTAGSPYYNPHVQRPAAFPPSDGYDPPEDPLVGVARQIAATAELKARHPRLTVVGSGYSYLQEWLANVAQRVMRDGGADFIGLGRMVLAYPEFAADVLAGRLPERKRLCRTFSDCTTAPRNGLPSGCFPLDPFYKTSAEQSRLARIKEETAAQTCHSNGSPRTYLGNFPR